MMKKFEFETNQGQFILLDTDSQPDKWYVDVKYMTEDQAENIIKADLIYNANDGSGDGDIDVYRDFMDGGNYCYTAKESLLSLFESHEVYLFRNPIFHPDDIEIQPTSVNWWMEQEELHLDAEEKTFKRPYIIKAIKKEQ